MRGLIRRIRPIGLIAQIGKVVGGLLGILLLYTTIFFALRSQSKVLISNTSDTQFVSLAFCLLLGLYVAGVIITRRVVVGIIVALLFLSSTIFWINIFPLAPQVEMTITLQHFFGRGTPGMNFLILPFLIILLFLVTFTREDVVEVVEKSTLHKAGKYVFYFLFITGMLVLSFVLVKTQHTLLALTKQQMFLSGVYLLLGSIAVGFSYLGKHMTSKSLLIVMSIVLAAMSLSMIRILQG